MTFEELLEQAIVLLQRRGRLTYRALKRQLNVDDDYLEDLKAELIQGQRLAVDEEGAVLVWTGGTDVSPRTAPPAPQPGVQPGTSDAHLTPSLPALATPPSPEAERRQLTVLFCDLVDSTVLSMQLDPEDLREVVRAYQATGAEVIQRFDGHIAQYLGDGLLVYFGYPQAHADDAQRAVRSGLGMVEAVGTLNTRLEPAYGVHLVVRLGIHTGLVVVGEVGSGGRQEQLALGETPNIAARLQGLAAPDTVVISAATAHLIHGYFVCQPLGAPALKGVAQPLEVYRVLRESGAQTRLDVVTPRGVTPLVGRDEEVGLMQRRWEQATTGMGQVVLLSGEAGIGKSRLVQVLKEHITAEPHTRIERTMGLWQEADLPGYFPLIAAALGAAYTLAGRVADAVPLLMHAMGQTMQMSCSLSLGEAQMLAGCLEQAHALAERALALARAHQERGHEAYALRLLGDIAARREPPESAPAEAHYQHALTLAEELGMRPLQAHCHHSLGTLYSQTGRDALARAALSTAIELYRAMDMIFWLPAVEAVLAQVERQ